MLPISELSTVAIPMPSPQLPTTAPPSRQFGRSPSCETPNPSAHIASCHRPSSPRPPAPAGWLRESPSHWTCTFRTELSPARWQATRTRLPDRRPPDARATPSTRRGQLPGRSFDAQAPVKRAAQPPFPAAEIFPAGNRDSQPARRSDGRFFGRSMCRRCTGRIDDRCERETAFQQV